MLVLSGLLIDFVTLSTITSQAKAIIWVFAMPGAFGIEEAAGESLTACCYHIQDPSPCRLKFGHHWGFLWLGCNASSALSAFCSL